MWYLIHFVQELWVLIKQTGSCWAFSVTENVESVWILSGEGSNMSVSLSPQQIVDCDQSDGVKTNKASFERKICIYILIL